MVFHPFNEAVELGMLPAASVHPVEAGRPRSLYYNINNKNCKIFEKLKFKNLVTSLKGLCHIPFNCFFLYCFSLIIVFFSSPKAKLNLGLASFKVHL